MDAAMVGVLDLRRTLVGTLLLWGSVKFKSQQLLAKPAAGMHGYHRVSKAAPRWRDVAQRGQDSSGGGV